MHRASGKLAAERPLRGAEPGDQRVVGENVDAARDAGGCLGDQPGGGRGHHLRQLDSPADPQPMVDVAEAFVEIEWRKAGLIARSMTWDSVKGDRPPQNAGTALSFAFSEHVRKINRKAIQKG